jgi:hypothetical protein
VLPTGDQPDQMAEVDRAGHRHGGLRRPAAAHRDDHGLQTTAGRQPRGGSGDRGLARPFPGSDHRERRHAERRALLGWIEPEVGTDVRNALGEGHGHEFHPLAIAEDRLVGEIQDDVRRELGDRGPQGTHPFLGDDENGNAEVGRIVARAKLLGPAHEQRGHDLVAAHSRRLERGAGHGRVVLPVHEGERSHVGSPVGDGVDEMGASSVSRQEPGRTPSHRRGRRPVRRRPTPG